jgi:hypothetical protein
MRVLSLIAIVAIKLVHVKEVKTSDRANLIVVETQIVQVKSLQVVGNDKDLSSSNKR